MSLNPWSKTYNKASKNSWIGGSQGSLILLTKGNNSKREKRKEENKCLWIRDLKPTAKQEKTRDTEKYASNMLTNNY